MTGDFVLKELEHKHGFGWNSGHFFRDVEAITWIIDLSISEHKVTTEIKHARVIRKKY